MQKIFIKTLLSMLALSCLTAQIKTRERVKSASLEDFSTAWTIEYLPYKILVQDAISKYINRDVDEKIKIPVFSISDELIIVRSLTNKSEINQIRYGNSKQGYIILTNKEIKWIFGATLRKTLLDRDTYYYLDYNVTASSKPNQLELDYIKNTNYWSNNDYTLDLPSRITYKAFNGYYAFNLHWGDEFLGLPYGSLWSHKLGISSKFFEFGVISPSILHFGNGFISRKDETDNLDKMSSGMGGYGRFQLSTFNGYLSFSSIPFLTDGIDTSDVYHMDFAGLVSYSLDFPLRKILPLYKGTTLFSVGFYAYHVSNGKIDSSSVLENSKAISINNTYSYLEKEEVSDYYSGAYFRVDGVSKIPQGRDFPRIKWAVQIHTGFSSMFKLVINFNDMVGMSTTYTKSLNDEIKWDSDNALYFSIIFHMSKTD